MSVVTLVTAALLLSRISAVFLVMPVFGTLGIPRLARGLFVVFMTVVVVPTVPQNHELATLPMLLGGVVSEFLVGLAMGSVVTLAFGSISLASEILSYQIGLGAAKWFDPLTKNTETGFGRILHWLAAAAFMGSNLHLAVLQAIAESFQRIPPGTLVQPGMLALGWPQLVSDTMAMGLRLATPILILVFLVQLFLAILARLAQSMNAFLSIGLVLTLGSGIFVLWVALPVMLRTHLDFVESVGRHLIPLALLGAQGG